MNFFSKLCSSSKKKTKQKNINSTQDIQNKQVCDYRSKKKG